MPQFETFKAWIEVDEIPLEEFNVEIDEEKRIVRCHVASEAGKEFVVFWSWKRYCDTAGHLIVDGRKRPTGRCGHRGRKQEGKIEDIRLPENLAVKGKLTFGNISMTDDESISLQDERLVKALGSIELEIRTGSQTPRYSRSQTVSGSSEPLSQQKPIYERMKKAGTHQVVLKDIRTSLPPSLYDLSRDNHKPVHFVFLYRSRDILLAQGIISREPTPVPNGRDSQSVEQRLAKEEEDEEPADDEEDARRLRALEEETAAIKARLKKRKSDGHDRPVLKKLKVEQIDAGNAFRPGEVIDLCDD